MSDAANGQQADTPDLDRILALNGANVIRGELHAVADAIRGLGDNALAALEKFVRDRQAEAEAAGDAPPGVADSMDLDLWLIEALRICRGAIGSVDRRSAARAELRDGRSAAVPRGRRGG